MSKEEWAEIMDAKDWPLCPLKRGKITNEFPWMTETKYYVVPTPDPKGLVIEPEDISLQLSPPLDPKSAQQLFDFDFEH